MPIIHAMLPIDPDRMDEALEVVDELVEKSNREPGIIDYRAAVDVQNDTHIRFFERYEDDEALEAHTETEHFQEFGSKLPELLAGEPEVTRYAVSDATELEL